MTNKQILGLGRVLILLACILMVGCSFISIGLGWMAMASDLAVFGGVMLIIVTLVLGGVGIRLLTLQTIRLFKPMTPTKEKV